MRHAVRGNRLRNTTALRIIEPAIRCEDGDGNSQPLQRLQKCRPIRILLPAYSRCAHKARLVAKNGQRLKSSVIQHVLLDDALTARTQCGRNH